MSWQEEAINDLQVAVDALNNNLNFLKTAQVDYRERLEALESLLAPVEASDTPIAQPGPEDILRDAWPSSSDPDSIEQYVPQEFECCGRGCGACDDRPVPEWRQGIEPVERVDNESALKDALYSLFIACNADEDNLRYALRSLVARCEAQVGDGWQADPDFPRVVHKDGRRRCDIGCLIDALNIGDEHGRWMTLGSRAAAWLRDLTDGAA